MVQDIHGFFFPSGLAVVGVSDTPSNLGRVIVENLQRFGFRGGIYPVGNSGGAVGGLKILRSVEEIEGSPDLAVLLIPARSVGEQLQACGRKGIRHVVVETGGFSEFSASNRPLEEEALAIAERHGMSLLGPNCFGIVNLDVGLTLPFFVLQPQYMRRGHASLISQSGGILYDTCMLCSVENVGLSKLVSMGNKLDLNETDFLAYLAGDPETKVIGLYLEDFVDGRELMRLAASCAKPVVILKANRSAAGREIARFHTAALAGDDAVADAAMQQARVHRVDNLLEMIDLFKIFGLPPMRGRRLGLITRSGGHGVLAADAAHRHGFELARFSDSFFQGAERAKRSNVIRATNPLDIGDVYNMGSYAELLELALQEEDVDGVGFIVTFSSESEGLQVEGFVKKASEIMSRHEKPVVLCVISNRDRWFGVKLAGDIPVFSDIDHALGALEHSFEHEARSAEEAGIASLPTGRRQSRRRNADGKTPGVRLLEGAQAFDLLKEYGLPVAGYALVREGAEACRAAKQLGYPVALKRTGADMLHKTERGGVRLDIGDDGQLQAALRDMGGDSFVLQKMFPPGWEMIIGARRDPDFGPVMVLGFGGTITEVLQDVSMRLAPIDRGTAREMISRLRGAALLSGFRGRRAADLEALEKVLLAVSRLCIDHPDMVNLDINPLILYGEGEGCVIVDAKLERKE